MAYTIEALLLSSYPVEDPLCARFLDLLLHHPKPFDRTSLPGHITGSAFILSPDRKKLLLTHHRKLDRWMQLGGHSDEDSDTIRVAHREGHEESGIPLESLSLLHPGVLDMDIHTIPAWENMPQHEHFDLAFLFLSDTEKLAISHESKALQWVPLEEVPTYCQDAHILRALAKIPQYL